MSFNLEIGLILLEELLLIALPGVAAAMFAASRGMRSQPLLLGVALVATGAAAMIVFWGFYLTPEVGKTLTFLIEIGSAAGAVAVWFGGKGREAMRELAVPLGLWILASFFVVYLGFLHGSTPEPIDFASHRFNSGLPTDNILPADFASWFYVHGHHGPPPPFGDWLSSDRPPLQIGYVLAVRPFGWDGSLLHYELMGVALQMLWVPGLWALLRATGLDRRARALAMVAVMVSDIAIIHGFYVWPKLIGAGFTLAAAAMIFAPQWKQWARQPWTGALFAALVALAMLCHGSSIFLVVPVVVFAFIRALPTWRWIGYAVLAAIVFYAPWQAYQHWGDPPGNRLVKWQIGGSEAIDNRGILQTIVDEYRREGLGGDLGNKWQNIQAIVGVGEIRAALNGSDTPEAAGGVRRLVEHIRFVRFFGLLPLIGFLLLGPLAMAFRAAIDRGGTRGPERRFAITGGILTVVACLFWALLMFGNSAAEAVVHQGALAVPVLAFAVCVAAAYAANRWFALGLVAFNAVFVLCLYVPVLKPPEGSAYSAVAILVAALALAGFCWAAWVSPGTTGDGEYTPAP